MMPDQFLEEFHLDAICFEVTLQEISFQASLHFGQQLPLSSSITTSR